MNLLRMETDVTHLNFGSMSGRILAHEHGPLYFVSSSRPRPSPDPGPTGRTLRCPVAGPAFRRSPATHLHGLRPTDLARGTAGHRHLLECQAGGALPLGLSRTGGQTDFGRCQRTTGLAAVGGLGEEP